MYLFSKRLFDLFLSIGLIILLSPILFIIIIFLFFLNSGDVFFLQQRVGFNNKIFNIMKFSTMLKNSKDLPGGSITLRNDNRVSKIGRILRITKLNELPQLFNVLKGNMSFVGPRPMLEEGFLLFSEEVKSIMYLSKPGITGISSLIFRDEEKLVTEGGMAPIDFYRTRVFPYKSQLEKWYFQNKSFTIDFMILFLTIVKIFAPRMNMEFRIFMSLPKSDYFCF